MPRPNEDIALFDLDGTLADYNGQMINDLNSIRGPNESVVTELSHGDDFPKELEARRKILRNQPGWWVNLPVCEAGEYVLRVAQEIGFKIHILTQGPLHAQAAWTEKLLWVQKHFPDVEDVTITRDKGLVYGKVLVDDWPMFAERWLANRPRGLVIMPAYNYNKDYKHPNVIRYDGTLESKEEVREALQKAKDR